MLSAPEKKRRLEAILQRVRSNRVATDRKLAAVGGIDPSELGSVHPGRSAYSRGSDSESRVAPTLEPVVQPRPLVAPSPGPGSEAEAGAPLRSEQAAASPEMPAPMEMPAPIMSPEPAAPGPVGGRQEVASPPAPLASGAAEAIASADEPSVEIEVAKEPSQAAIGPETDMETPELSSARGAAAPADAPERGSMPPVLSSPPETKLLEPRLTASGDIVSVTGVLESEWSLESVLDRAWSLGLSKKPF